MRGRAGRGRVDAHGNVQVVSAGPELTNQRSRRVFKKLGFTCEGTARRARMLSGGEYADEIRYSLLREEYRPQPAPK